METQLKETQGERYLCKNTFNGLQTQILLCNECGNIIEKDEDFFLVSVEVKDKKDLNDSLNHMVKGEIISDYNCEPCQKKVDITKKSVFKQLPNTLIVRLNRIRFDYDTLRNVKENDRLEFSTSLNMRPYMLDEVVRKDKALIREK